MAMRKSILAFVTVAVVVAAAQPAGATDEPAVPPGAARGPWAHPGAWSGVDYLLDLKTGESTPLPRRIRRGGHNG